MSSKGRRTGGTKKSQDLQDIQIRGARQNNLGGVDVDIPKARLTVVTGVSGSGKSSLAFDTLYAEGQRRYVESFSTYARQFLERMDRPDVDSIDGLLPAVALEQKNAIRSSRSTLATLTEVADYLKVLFAKLATLLCPTCGNVVEPDLPGPIVDELLTTHAGKRLIVTFPFRAGEGEDAVIASQFLQREGFGRILGDEGSVIRLEGLDAQTGKLAVIIDRLAIRDIERQRLVEAIETAYTASHGEATLHIEGQKGVFEIRDLFQERHCCGVTYPAPVEGVFSFNSPIGACETCRGFGRVIDIDMHRVVPDDRLTLKQGAIAPWTGNKGIKRRKALREICADADIDYEKTPWRELSTAQQDLILEGRGGPRGWDGVRGWFKALETKLYKMHVRVFLSRYRSYLPCGDCGGSRFKAESLYYRLGEVTIADVLASTVQDAKHWLETLPVTSTVDALAPVVEHLTNRLYYLVHVGIGYLTLSRQARTLSGGEVQRANLTTALGSGLVNTLFVLDEPTIGLHPADSDRLAVMLAELTERDNTVVLVEHDPDMLRVADHIIEMGPGPGALGGEVIFAGEASALATTAKTSATALALAHRQGPRVARNADVTVLPGVTIRGASAQNLKGVDAHFPYGHLTVVSGVSGSGKSTLMGQVLHRGYLRRNGKVTDAPGACEAIDGLDRISELIWVDQSPPAASSRANPATYVKAWDGVRKLFAEQPLSKRRRYTPGTFSFNSGDGRCPACEGAGFEKVEMQFLADVQLRCEACEGTRFKPSVLEVKWEGLSVADVLSLTVEEACVRFGKTAGVARRLKALQDVGLGYLRLGQSLATLSGGESQRVKLAQHLHARKKQRHLMFLLDEPTTGLHLADVDRLVDNLRVLTQRGNTVVVIEHHLDVIAAADHVIDLGPEGGDRGGSIVFAGSPRGLSESGTLTGEHLARWLAGIAPLERPAASASKPKKRTSHLGGDVAIAGARVHNLKNISVRFPRGKRTVVSGVSGSGKSSLAFDIVFAEGQRRFLDCVSAYARQYITQLARPDADVIAGIPPTVAIEQRTTRGGSRSTVANVTEIEPFLRLLYARLGEVRQDASGRVTPKALAEHLDLVDGSAQVSVTAPVVQSRQGFHQKVFVDAHELGIKVFVNGTLRSPNPLPRLRRRNHHDVDFLYGTLAANSGADLAKAIARAAIKANGQVKVFRDGFTPRLFEVAAEGVTRRETLDPRYFSPRTSLGACVECSGRGIISPDDREDDMPDIVCPSCDGQRLGPIGRSVAISGRSLPELTAMTAPGVVAFLDGLKLDKRKQAIAAGPVKAIRERAQFLDEVGLTYLTLNRGVRTLSGGESQRIRLAAQLGAHLSGVLYVLDEPTIGLHPTDTEVLLSTLDRLQARGNGILMVEHDEMTLRTADVLIDVGPGAGVEGGEIMVVGPLKKALASKKSITGRCLASPRPPVRETARSMKGAAFIDIVAAEHHNLDRIDIRVPRARLTVVSGVSGSGKSSLVDVVMHAVRPTRGGGVWESAKGLDDLEHLVQVDDKPIGKNPRSTPATYVGVWDTVRLLFASLPDSKIRGYKPGRFSFNVKGGRCEACSGNGLVKLEMSFLPDAYVPCDLCGGRRFNRQTLEVKYNGHSIHEVLELNVREALVLFERVPKIARKLQLLDDVGLGYLSLGQPSPTLSGGEAQRIKLVSHLGGRNQPATLIILDEPSIGLHMADVPKLLEVLHRLVDAGATVVVIEHNTDILREADWVIDMGPGPGEAGGEIVYEGAYSGLSGTKRSRTGMWLAQDAAQSNAA